MLSYEANMGSAVSPLIRASKRYTVLYTLHVKEPVEASGIGASSVSMHYPP